MLITLCAGLWSFATVTTLLGCFNLFLPWKSNHVIYPTALLFGGIAQYIAGFLDLFYGGTFSGTILVSYGAFWAGQGMMMLPTASAVLDDYSNEADVAQANSLYNFIWAFYTLMLLGISFRITTGNFILSWYATDASRSCFLFTFLFLCRCLFWVFLTLLFDAIFYLTQNQPLMRASGKINEENLEEDIFSYTAHRCYSYSSRLGSILFWPCGCDGGAETQNVGRKIQLAPKQEASLGLGQQKRRLSKCIYKQTIFQLHKIIFHNHYGVKDKLSFAA